MSDPLAVQITGREIYDRLVLMHGDLQRVAHDVSAIRGDVEDHEARIRALERGRWPLPSIAALVAIAALVVSALALTR